MVTQRIKASILTLCPFQKHWIISNCQLGVLGWLLRSTSKGWGNETRKD